MPCITGKRILAVALAATPANGMNESAEKNVNTRGVHISSPKLQFSNSKKDEKSEKGSPGEAHFEDVSGFPDAQKSDSAKRGPATTLARSLRSMDPTNVRPMAQKSFLNNSFYRPLQSIRAPSSFEKERGVRDQLKKETVDKLKEDIVRAKKTVDKLQEGIVCATARISLANRECKDLGRTMTSYQDLQDEYGNFIGQENADMMYGLTNGEDPVLLQYHEAYKKAMAALPSARQQKQNAIKAYKQKHSELLHAKSQLEELEHQMRNIDIAFPQSQTLEGDGFDYIEPVEQPNGSVIMEQILEDEGFDYIEPVEQPNGSVIMEQDNQAQNFLVSRAYGPMSRNVAANRADRRNVAPNRADTFDSRLGTGSSQPREQGVNDLATLLSRVFISKTSGIEEEQKNQDSSEDLVKQESRVDDNSSGVNGFTF